MSNMKNPKGGIPKISPWRTPPKKETHNPNGWGNVNKP